MSDRTGKEVDQIDNWAIWADPVNDAIWACQRFKFCGDLDCHGSWHGQGKIVRYGGWFRKAQTLKEAYQLLVEWCHVHSAPPDHDAALRELEAEVAQRQAVDRILETL